MLAITGLSVSFPGLTQPVLDIPALAIATGERIAVTGPSGSGKTTLVNIITGLERVRSGRVVWDGVDLATLPEARRDRWRAATIGLVMQEFHLFPGLSALDNVLLPARLESRRLAAGLKRRAIELLERTGIARHGQMIDTLSRGEMQRVALARALVRRPPVVVADEPSASLDEASGAAVGDLLVELAGEDLATLIVVSHDERLIRRMRRRIDLRNGRLHGEAA